MTNRYIFSKGNIQNNISVWNEEMRGYARIFSFQSMLELYKKEYTDGGGNVYVMHAIIAAMMLIFGVAGYNIMMFDRSRKMYGIYFMSGMKWKYTIAITAMENLITMILPGIIGGVLAISKVSSIRFFDIQTRLMAMLTGIGAIGAICLLSTVSFIMILYRNKPKGLIGAE